MSSSARHGFPRCTAGQARRAKGVFDGAVYLATRQGPLLEPLRDPAYFNRCFVDAEALCWPNGLELSAARLHGLVNAAQMA